MSSAVCTLFEGHFHHGVAVLVNSLYKNGFRGDFYAGYKGALPAWSNNALPNAALAWAGGQTLRVAENLRIHFLPVVTTYHLAHYKPAFMLQVLQGPAKYASGLAYFDPDIVNLCRWGFYEEWMAFGVAMVHEVVSNDMPATHPSRMEWKNVVRRVNRQPRREIHSYINSGFCGVARKHIEFLRLWAEIIEVAIREYKMDERTFMTYDKSAAFYCIDQDSFNIAAMCSDSPISEMGPEAMDFVGAGWTMSHATGSPKPWKNKFILSALRGNPPTRPHKNFWNHIKEPINLHSDLYSWMKKGEIFFAILIGRFYRRS